MNRQDIHCDETENFRCPQSPRSGEPYRVTLRVDRGRRVSVSLYARADERETLLPAAFGGYRGRYALYEAIAPGAREYGCYYFRLQEGSGPWLYYGRGGLADSREQVVPFEVFPGEDSPAWARGLVWYQIFPDRFCNGRPDNDGAAGEYTDELGHRAQNVPWEAPIEEPDVNRFYGGDLAGIRSKLDYLQQLGVKGLYLNPVFASPSSHRYNITDYDRVDRRLGTGEELAELIGAAHERGMRVLLDGVFNHCSAFHPWAKKEAGGIPYVRRRPDGSRECWWDNPSLPKLAPDDCPQLEEELLAVCRRYLQPPYCADGWRLDVAADLGHSAAYNHHFWQRFRQEARRANPQAFILAEHYGDPLPWLRGNEWDSVMNYDGFMDPVSCLLTGMEKHGDRFEAGLLANTEAFWQTMEAAMARLPREALLSALNQLDNHDHSRFITRTNHKVGRLCDLGSAAAGEGVSLAVLTAALVLQMTWPGAPGLYYGDEAALPGFTDPDNRRPFPWGKENPALEDIYACLIRLHRRDPLWTEGSLLPLEAAGGVLAYGRLYRGRIGLVVINCGQEAAQVALETGRISGEAPQTLRRIWNSGPRGYNAGQLEEPAPGGLWQRVLEPQEAVVLLGTGKEELK